MWTLIIIGAPAAGGASDVAERVAEAAPRGRVELVAELLEDLLLERREPGEDVRDGLPRRRVEQDEVGAPLQELAQGQVAALDAKDERPQVARVRSSRQQGQVRPDVRRDRAHGPRRLPPIKTRRC